MSRVSQVRVIGALADHVEGLADLARLECTRLSAVNKLRMMADLSRGPGRVPHDQKMATIELYGREVIPRVRELLADPGTDRAASVSPVAATSGSSNARI